MGNGKYHVHTESRKRPRDAQQRDMRETDKITYTLRAEKGRDRLSSEIFRKHKITYCLRAEKVARG
jgi:hypothetical protein